MKHTSRWSALIFSTLVLSAAARESAAQSVAYRTHGTGSYSPVTFGYGGVGVGTHLGKHTFDGMVATSPTDNPLVVDFVLTVPQETVAANGDKLYFTGSGQVEFIPLDATLTTFMAIWEGDFVVVAGPDASRARSRPTSRCASWRLTIRSARPTRCGRSPGS